MRAATRAVAGLCLGLFGVAVAATPAPARANCAMACNSQKTSCAKGCAGESKKAQPDCYKSCDELARLCPPMCEIGRRNKGNPQRTQQESKALYERMRPQPQKEAKKEGH